MSVRKLVVAVLACLLTLAGLTSAMARERYALVIGNSDYSDIQKLKNPAHDAELMTRTLRQIGFKVFPHKDLGQKKLRRAVREFTDAVAKAGPDTLALFYYAGHGLQVDGANYLVPTDAVIKDSRDIRIEAVGADEIMAGLRHAGAKVNVVILDACRNNPYMASSRSITRGLARMNAPTGSFIAYATAPGQVADDGTSDNSPFTSALASIIVRPGLKIEEAFKLVRRRVHDESNGKQRPMVTSELYDDIYLAGKDGTAPPPTDNSANNGTPPPSTETPQPAPSEDARLAFYRALDQDTLEAYEDFLRRYPNHEKAENVRQIVRSMSEEAMWQRARTKNALAGYRQYLLAFPNGQYRNEANTLIAILERQNQPVPPPTPVPVPDPVQPEPEPAPINQGNCGAPHGPWRVVGVESWDVLNIRSGPSTRRRIVYGIPPNGRGIAIGRCRGKWCRVRYKCHSGWASRKYLARSGGGSSGGGSSSKLYRVTGHSFPDKLNVRSGPGVRNRIVHRIPHNGTNVRVFTCRRVSGSSKWCSVRHRGIRGWVNSRYLGHMVTGRRP